MENVNKQLLDAAKLAYSYASPDGDNYFHPLNQHDRARIDAAIAAAEQAEPLEKSGCQCGHDSDCAIHNMPAFPAGPCNCSVRKAFEIRFKHLGLEPGRTMNGKRIYVRDLAHGAWLGFNAAMAAATNPFSAVPDGYALVPIEPTAEMLGAADRIEWADSDVVGNYYNMWNAMLAAAQKGDQ